MVRRSRKTKKYIQLKILIYWIFLLNKRIILKGPKYVIKMLLKFEKYSNTK
jgi:hypothetical protein